MPFPARSLCISVLVLAAWSAAPPAWAVQPTPLEAQLTRLAGLLGDSYATVHPEATQLQKLGGPYGEKLVLALFTIEAYGGGNNHRQYLALFEEEVDESGPRGHVMLRGLTQVGAKGWRAVHRLQAEARFDKASGTVQFLVPALVNTPSDAANFPSKPAAIRLVLDRSGFAEAPAGGTP